MHRLTFRHRNSEESRSGMNLLDVVQVVLIILKLFHLITIPWWQVFIPFYIELGIFLILLIIGFILYKRM